MGDVKVTNVLLDDTAITGKIRALLTDDAMLEIHNLFAKTINPWVPMDEGVLAQSAEITPEHVRYPGPYAHYIYTGEIYGPNIPIRQDGQIVGWWSPPGRPKMPTGRPITYSTERHPLASKEWDKAAMQSEMASFAEGVKEILIRRARALYG